MHAATFLERTDPLTERIVVPSGHPNYGPCSVDQQGSKVCISTLSNSEQNGTSARGALPGDQTQPGSYLAAIVEGSGITELGDERAGNQRSDSTALHQSSTRFMRRGKGFDACAQPRHLSIKIPQSLHLLRKVAA